MNGEEQKEVFLSCFKCGRIVRSTDSECPRCGLQFGPGTLFECPFCSGLIWRNATICTTCGTDLTAFSEGVERSSSGFDMDEFVDNIISTEIEQMKTAVRRVACPGCGLMIRGDESKCPRCDLPLAESEVDCPVCGEKMPVSSKECPNCSAHFREVLPVEASAEMLVVLSREKVSAEPQLKAAKKRAAPKKKPSKKPKAKKAK